MEQQGPKYEVLVDIVRIKMPFGKFKGTLLCDLPILYLEWFKREGWPPGKLGELLDTVYEIKLNGLNDIIFSLKRMYKEEQNSNTGQSTGSSNSDSGYSGR